MKVFTNKLTLLSLILFISASLALTSCSHDPIFNIIDSEVKPEKNGICGHINSFVTFNQNLYLSTSFLYEKKLVSSSESGILNGGWERIADSSTEAFKDRSIIYIAADSNYLYAYTVTYGFDDSHVIVPDSVMIFYSSDARNWTQIDDEKFTSCLNSSISKISKPLNDGTVTVTATNDPLRYIIKIFDNQAIASEKKNAYVVLLTDYANTDEQATKLFKLNGGEDLVEVTAGTNNSLNMNTMVSKENALYSPRHSITAVNYNGQDYFFEYTGITADENYIYLSPENSRIMVANGWDSSKRKSTLSNVLKTYSIESYGFTYNGTECEDEKTVKTNSGDILSIAITKDYMLLGTETGIYQVSINSERIPGEETKSFSTNAASVLHSPYSVTNIFVFDPQSKEADTDIYASNEYYGYYSTNTTVLFEDIGLWAYYPSRGNWNKDGTKTAEDKKSHLPAGN